ncbi:MAG TPA: hypothetical protein VJ654_09455 [Noviherbaspirillum sp.]|nr:hypothetical protein [Noviherbaspirillum sp.]
MPSNADPVTLTLLVLLAVLVIGILAYAGSARAKARRSQHNLLVISHIIIDYFRRSGVEVTATCTRLESSGAFIAVVESEPMKRFRLSHIIEMTLREHVHRACGLELDKVYWRFPIKDAAPAAMAAAAATSGAAGAAVVNGEETKQPGEPTDDYINEGLEHYRHIPKPEVTELPWETFEEMSTTITRERKDEGEE